MSRSGVSGSRMSSCAVAAMSLGYAAALNQRLAARATAWAVSLSSVEVNSSARSVGVPKRSA